MYDLATYRPKLLVKDKILMALTDNREDILDVINKYIAVVQGGRYFLLGETVYDYKNATSVLRLLLKMPAFKKDFPEPMLESFEPVNYEDLLDYTRCSVSPCCTEGFLLANEMIATPVSLLRQVIPINDMNLDFWDQIKCLLNTGEAKFSADELFTYGMKILLKKTFTDDSDSGNELLIKLLTGDIYDLQSYLLRLICEERGIKLFVYDHEAGSVESFGKASDSKIALFVGKYTNALRIMIPHTSNVKFPEERHFLKYQHEFQQEKSVMDVRIADLQNLPTLLENYQHVLRTSGYVHLVFCDPDFEDKAAKYRNDTHGRWGIQTVHLMKSNMYFVKTDISFERRTFNEARTHVFPQDCTYDDELVNKIMKESLKSKRRMFYMKYAAAGVIDHGFIFRTIFGSNCSRLDTQQVGSEGKNVPFYVATAGCSVNNLVAETCNECRIIIMERGSGVRVFFIVSPSEHTHFRQWAKGQFHESNVPIMCKNWIAHECILFDLDETLLANFKCQKVVLKEGQMLILAPGAISFGINVGESFSQEFNMYVEVPENQEAYQPLCTPQNDLKVSNLHLPHVTLKSNVKLACSMLCEELLHKIAPFTNLLEDFNSKHQEFNFGLDHLQAIDEIHKIDSRLKFRKADQDQH